MRPPIQDSKGYGVTVKKQVERGKLATPHFSNHTSNPTHKLSVVT